MLILALAPLTLWASSLFVVGAAPCIVGCWAMCLASMPSAPDQNIRTSMRLQTQGLEALGHCDHDLSRTQVDLYLFLLFRPHCTAGGNLSSPTRDRTHSPCIARWVLNHWTTRESTTQAISFRVATKHWGGTFEDLGFVPKVSLRLPPGQMDISFLAQQTASLLPAHPSLVGGSHTTSWPSETWLTPKEGIHHSKDTLQETQSSCESCHLQSERWRDFPGSPVATTLYSECRGPGFNPWSGN